MLMTVGAAPRLYSRLRKDNREYLGWVKWYVDAMVRSAGLFPINLDRAQRDIYRRFLMNRLEFQANGYHSPRYLENKCIVERIRLIGTVLFVVAVIACTLQMALLALLPFPFVHLTWLAELRSLVGEFTSIAILFTIWGAALAAFAYQAEFSKLAQISRIVERQLHRLYCQADGSPNSGEYLRALASESTHVCMEEHEDWYLFYSLRELDKPN